MFDELEKYKENGSFIFKSEDRLSLVCNAPGKCSGIYLIYAFEKGQVNLIYIGISGRKGTNGEIVHRKDGLRGRFLTGKTNGVLRKIYWPQRMILENIEALNIQWYVTHGKNEQDFPRDLEIKLLNRYRAVYGVLPRWNKNL